ncbi:MAG: hypothetical protein V2A73_07835 [Pseudomonadota bacterium]
MPNRAGPAVKWPCVLIASAVLVLGGCASQPGSRSQSSAVKAPSAVLVLGCDHNDAVVWIDGRLVGEAVELQQGIRLDAGTHRIELRHEEHLTRYLQVDLRPGERLVVDTKLAESLD